MWNAAKKTGTTDACKTWPRVERGVLRIKELRLKRRGATRSSYTVLQTGVYPSIFAQDRGLRIVRSGASIREKSARSTLDITITHSVPKSRGGASRQHGGFAYLRRTAGESVRGAHPEWQSAGTNIDMSVAFDRKCVRRWRSKRAGTEGGTKTRWFPEAKPKVNLQSENWCGTDPKTEERESVMARRIFGRGREERAKCGTIGRGGRGELDRMRKMEGRGEDVASGGAKEHSLTERWISLRRARGRKAEEWKGESGLERDSPDLMKLASQSSGMRVKEENTVDTGYDKGAGRRGAPERA
ncbi:hypothetical protein B0H11DRAFT_2191155 [Mycena galericulata]|nr:hypothetical protein B0H11DRAFT_2191155 [Mycena galericulata]